MAARGTNGGGGDSPRAAKAAVVKAASLWHTSGEGGDRSPRIVSGGGLDTASGGWPTGSRSFSENFVPKGSDTDIGSEELDLFSPADQWIRSDVHEGERRVGSSSSAKVRKAKSDGNVDLLWESEADIVMDVIDGDDLPCFSELSTHDAFDLQKSISDTISVSEPAPATSLSGALEERLPSGAGKDCAPAFSVSAAGGPSGAESDDGSTTSSGGSRTPAQGWAMLFQHVSSSAGVSSPPIVHDSVGSTGASGGEEASSDGGANSDMGPYTHWESLVGKASVNGCGSGNSNGGVCAANGLYPHWESLVRAASTGAVSAATSSGSIGHVGLYPQWEGLVGKARSGQPATKLYPHWESLMGKIAQSHATLPSNRGTAGHPALSGVASMIPETIPEGSSSCEAHSYSDTMSSGLIMSLGNPEAIACDDGSHGVLQDLMCLGDGSDVMDLDLPRDRVLGWPVQAIPVPTA